MTNYAEIIRDRLKMGDVLRGYGLANKDQGRIPCPIHNGKDKNFAYKQKRFKCFVCNAEGTVIDFAMAYHGISFQDALKRLNDDFCLGLPIGKELSYAEQEEINRIAYQRRKEQERKKKRYETLLTAYHSALDEWIRLDSVIRKEAPETPFDGFTEEYADAVKRIDFAGFKLDAAERELYRFEKT